MSGKDYPRTPHGRYFAVRGRLWRTFDPALSAGESQRWVDALIDARRGGRAASKADDPVALRKAREAVQAAKVALGERGPVWWRDGAPDLNRRMAGDTPYAAWHAGLDAG